MYELHKTWCADTLLSNSVICAIGVLQHDLFLFVVVKL